MNTTTVLTEDLWAALDALGAAPKAQQTEWYKRLEQAADAATQAMLLDKGLITEQLRNSEQEFFGAVRTDLQLLTAHSSVSELAGRPLCIQPVTKIKTTTADKRRIIDFLNERINSFSLAANTLKSSRIHKLPHQLLVTCCNNKLIMNSQSRHT